VKPDGTDGVTERQAGLSIPGSGVRRCFASEQVAGPQQDKAVEAEKCRRGSSNSFVGPLALCLNAQMSAGFGEGDLDLPPADVQGDDLSQLEGDIGTEETLRIALSVGAVHQDPTDRQHRGTRPVRQGLPDVISSALPLTWPYQAETKILVQLVAGLDSRVLSFGNAGPFCAGRPSEEEVLLEGGANRFASNRRRLKASPVVQALQMDVFGTRHAVGHRKC
jgi:hypothetical protein